jgi:hypothetical protein
MSSASRSVRGIGLTFSLRTMLVLVALAGMICLGGRELWLRWLGRDYRNPVYPSQLSARAGRRMDLVWNAEKPIPVAITYNLCFGLPKPAPGATCKLLAEVWFEDLTTGRAVEGYTFDVLLTAGGRELASETFNWDAVLPRPGEYNLRYRLSWYTPGGDLRLINGGGALYRIAARGADIEQLKGSGENP